MGEPPEFWLFLASNLLLLVLGGVLAGMSMVAYRRSPDNPALQGASIGFGLITLGALVEAIYELGIRGSYELGGRELLALHSIEGILIAFGMGALFYTLRKY